MTNIEKLRILGEALHGPRFMRAIASNLGVNYRTVLRWGAGQGEPNAGHVADLMAIAKERRIQIDEAIARSVS